LKFSTRVHVGEADAGGGREGYRTDAEVRELGRTDLVGPNRRSQCAGWNPYFKKIGFAAALVTKSSNRCASGLAPFVKAMG
jgi:hypothetical protein